MTAARWEEIERAIWKVEIGLDSAMCEDGGEGEATQEAAERLLEDATRLRKRLIRVFGPAPLRRERTSERYKDMSGHTIFLRQPRLR